MKRWRRILVVFGTLLCLFLGAAYLFSGLFLPASPRKQIVRVEIPARSTTSSIADLLASRGVIRSKHAFVLSSRLLGVSNQMKAGDYELDAHQGLLEIIDKIARGDAIARAVTVPEGYTIKQVAALLEQRRMASARTFMEQCDMAGAEIKDVDVPRSSIEGYLLPDTYKFKQGVPERAIVQAMTGNFKKQVIDSLGGAIKDSGRSLDEIVVIASLIEREARVPGDRDKISAVIRNRLKKKMRLQIDATVLYALGRHQSRLLFKDLKVDHPYNTYRNAGLPPGPICNPGIECIRAAVFPAEVKYLYYVAQKDGSHYFSTTYDEHKRNGGT